MGPTPGLDILALQEIKVPNHPACNPIVKPTMLCQLPLFTHAMEQSSSSEIHSPYLVMELPHFIETKCCFITNQCKFRDVISIKNIVFWDALPCEWVRLYQCFAGNCCLRLQGRNAPLKTEKQFCLKCYYSSTQLHFAEKKKHNLETDACLMVTSQTLTPANDKYHSNHSISHSCCDMSFIQLRHLQYKKTILSVSMNNV
jgi:hypothetical protein